MIIPDYTFKVCLYGDSEVGKTTLSRRFVSGNFETNIRKTLGVEVCVKYVTIDDKKVTIQIWDFGGEDNFKFLLPTYARGSSGGIFMYDLSNSNSLNNMETWFNTFFSGLAPTEKKIPILIVGGKSDLTKEANLNIGIMDILKEKYHIIDIVDCSSKTGENVDNILNTLTNFIWNKNCAP